MSSQAQEMSAQEVVNILDKIKKEMMERRQLTAQMKTNRQLEEMNKNLKTLNSQTSRVKEKPEINIKFPTVSEIVEGFMRSSPIFGRAFSGWMKDTVNLAKDNNAGLDRIAEKIEGLGGSKGDGGEREVLSTEYLDMISTQLSENNADSLKRLDNSSESLERMNATLVRVDDSLKAIQKSEDTGLKNQRDQIVRLFGIENKIGAVGGHIVNSLQRIFNAQEQQRQKDEFRRAEEGKEVGGTPRAGSVTPTPEAGEDSNGSSGVLGAIAAMLGLTTMKAFLSKPFKAIGRIVGKFLGMFGKLGEGTEALLGPFGKALKFLKVGPLALIGTLIDFGKGFFDAKEILGKDKVTIIDRFRAGTVELLGGIGDIVDWVAKLFGFDTGLGKSIREEWLKISEPLANFSQSIVDWFKNDLFGGITTSTALTDIPGKIGENFTNEVHRLIDWVVKGFTDFIDDGIEAITVVMDDIKKGFAEKVKKPFLNMVNSITNAMFDLVDKFVSIIPDSLGGDAARKKMEEARQSMLITTDDPAKEGAAGANAQAQSNAPTNTPPGLQPAPPEAQAQNVTNKPQLNWAYPAEATSAPIQGAAPVAGKAVSNIEQMKAAYGSMPSSVVMPVQQNVDNSKKVSNVTNYNSTSLEPANKSDQGRMFWDW